MGNQLGTVRRTMFGSPYFLTIWLLLLFQIQPFANAVKMEDVQSTEEILSGLTNQVEQLEADLTQIRKNMSEHLVSTRTSLGKDAIGLFDYYLSGYTTQCGPQQVTGWTKNVDEGYKADGTAFTSSLFSGNQFTAPTVAVSDITTGLWHICGWLRFKKDGNAVDIAMRVNGNRVAAFGDAIRLIGDPQGLLQLPTECRRHSNHVAGV